MPSPSRSCPTRAASWRARSAVLGVALLGVLSGCDEGAPGAPPAASARSQPRSAHIGRQVNSTYEGIDLNRDGTYNRTVVDRWGRAHQQQGTWRGFGGTIPTRSKGGGSLSRQIDLDSYSETRDIINSQKSVPTKTKRISPYEYYIR